MQCVYLINLLFNILLWSSVRMAAYCRWFSGSFPPSLVPPHCRPSWGAGHGWIPLGRSPDHWLWLRCSQGELRAAQSPPPVRPRPRSPLASASSTPPDSAPSRVHGHFSQAALWEEECLARQHPSLASDWLCDAGWVSCAFWASVSPLVRTVGEVTDSSSAGDGSFASSGRCGAWAQVAQFVCPGARRVGPFPPDAVTVLGGSAPGNLSLCIKPLHHQISH